LGDSRAGVLPAVQSTEAISSKRVALILPVNKLSLTPPPERAQVDPEGPPPVDALVTQLQANLTWRKSKRITAVAAYEDASSEPRVGEFCLNLARQLGKSPELSKAMWLFSELRPTQLRSVAASEAAVADLIIISVHHQESLPEEINDWIHMWLDHKDKKPSVLVALFEPVYQGDSTSMHAYLKDVAKQGNMELFVQTEELREPD